MGATLRLIGGFGGSPVLESAQDALAIIDGEIASLVDELVDADRDDHTGWARAGRRAELVEELDRLSDVRLRMVRLAEWEPCEVLAPWEV